MSSLDYGTSLSQSKEGSISYFGYREYGAANDEFVTTGKLVGATLYSVPTNRYIAPLEKAQFVGINTEGGQLSRLNKVSGAVSSYGEERRLHFKSYTRVNERGDLEAFLPTGNLSKNTAGDEGTFFSNILSNLGLGQPQQDNTGVLLTGRLASKFLEFQRSVVKGEMPQGLKLNDEYSLIRGEVTAATLIEAIGRTGKDDRIQLTSPFLNNATLLEATIAAKKRGANISVTMAPGYNSTVERERTKERLAKEGINVYTSTDNRLVHQKNFAISGPKIKLAGTGSDNLSNSSASNKTLEYMLVAEGNSKLLSNLLQESEDLSKQLQKVEANRSAYEDGEFAYLYNTTYSTSGSRSGSSSGSSSVNGGFVKPTKLNTSYFTRHLRNRQNKYEGFTNTYEAITGIYAPGAVSSFDDSLGTASLGHKLNYLLGIQLYRDGAGVLGSAVTAIGKLLDTATGHYAFRDDMQRRKQKRGSISKFQTIVDESWQSNEEYQGGPIEKTIDTFYQATRGLFTGAVAFSGVFAIQSIATIYLEEGAKRLLEPNAKPTALQQVVIQGYLSPIGRTVLNTAKSLMQANDKLSSQDAYIAAMTKHQVLNANEMLGSGGSAPGIINRFRQTTASFMEYVLPSVIRMVVPEAKQSQALEAGKALVDALGRPISLSTQGLQNLQAERNLNIGKALESLSTYVPLEMHMWIPSIRAVLDPTSVNNAPSLGSTLGVGTPNLPSLSQAIGRGLIGNTISGFLGIANKLENLIVNPDKELLRLQAAYKSSHRSLALDIAVAKQLETSTQDNALANRVRSFLHQQSQTSKLLSTFSNEAASISASSGNGVSVNLPKSFSIKRIAIGLGSLFLADAILDEALLKNQGSDLFQQLALIRTTRTHEGNITQIELTPTLPGALSLGVAGLAGLSGGYTFPTIYSVSRHDSPTLARLATATTPKLQELAQEVSEYRGTRARFNFKAAVATSIMALAATKAAFAVGTSLLDTVFPTKGVKLDAESETLTSVLLGILNKTQSSNYSKDSEETIVSQSANLRSLLIRETLKSAVDLHLRSATRRDTLATNSSNYTIAAQPTNLGFMQLAIVQRTDAAKQRTSYSFGVQLFALAGTGMSPVLPIGIGTRLPNEWKQAYLQRLNRNSAHPNSLPDSMGEALLTPFGFLTYDPNSHVSKSLMAIGSLTYLQSALTYTDDKLAKYGTPLANKSKNQLDLDDFRKVAKLGLHLTEAALRYGLALSDFLPKMAISGLRAGLKDIPSPKDIGVLRVLGRSIYRHRYGILGYAIGVAMTDPTLGVESVDETDSRVLQHPFATGGARFTAAASAAVFGSLLADDLGLTGTRPNSLTARILPKIFSYQQTLNSVEATALQKSAAKVGVIAAGLFAVNITASAISRTIGQIGGEAGLEAAYQTVGLLRLLSGVSASEYRQRKGNVLGDLIGDVITKIPFIGQPLADLTGFYSKPPNPYLPVFGTPFGFSYGEDGNSRAYAQSQSGTIDLSASAYSKGKGDESKSLLQLFQNLERANLENVTNPDALAYALLLGGAPRTKRIKVSQLSRYGTSTLRSSGLQRALRLRQALTENLINQRPGEYLLKEIYSQHKVGLANIWNGSGYDRVTSVLGMNWGQQMNFVPVVSKTLGAKTSYEVFAASIEGETASARVQEITNPWHSLQGMYDSYTPSNKKDSPNAIGVGILSAVGTGLSIVVAASTTVGLLETVGAVETVKYGRSLNRIQSQRLESVDAFLTRNRLDIRADVNNFDKAVASNKYDRSGSGFTRAFDLKSQRLNVKQLQQAYKQTLNRIETYFKTDPSDLLYAAKLNGATVNAFDELLTGNYQSGKEILHSKFLKLIAADSVSAKNSGILNVPVGNTNYRSLFLDIDKSMSATAYAQSFLSVEIYDVLEQKARELNLRKDLSAFQKRELLLAAKNKLEMTLLERHVLGMPTNSLVEADLVPEIAPRGSGFSSTLKRAASGGGLLLSGYMGVGKPAYALAESTTILLSSDRRLHKYAARKFYDTSLELGLSLATQKVISKAFGGKMFSLGTLAATIGVSLGANILFDRIKQAAWGKGIARGEEWVARLASKGIATVADIVSYLPGISHLGSFFADTVFKPTGLKIAGAYNAASNKSLADGIIAELLLPESIYKRNNFIPKGSRWGTQYISSPWVTTDLTAYYQAQRNSEVKATMYATPVNLGVNDYLASDIQSSDYYQNVLYERWFKQRIDGTPSPLTNFAIHQHNQISEGTLRGLQNRASLKGYYQYGKDFRKAASPYYDYVSQALFGTGTTNELLRIATHANASSARVLADSYAGIDKYAIDPAQRVVKGLGRRAIGGYLIAISKIPARTPSRVKSLLSLPSNVISRLGSWLGNTLGGVKTVSSVVAGTTVVTVRDLTAQATADIETKLAKSTVYLERNIAPTAAYIGIKALQATAFVLGSASRLALTGLSKIPTKDLPTLPEYNRPRVNFNVPVAWTKDNTRLINTASATWKTFSGHLPLWLDLASLLPSTLSLQSLGNPNQTKMEVLATYERQGATVAGTLSGLALAATRANLLTSVVAALATSYVGGRLARAAGSSDYDKNETTYQTLLTVTGYLTMGLSAAQSLWAFHRRLATYDNHVEIITDSDGNKTASVNFDEKMLKRQGYLQTRRQKLITSPNSSYKNQQLARIDRELMQIHYEKAHEFAHNEQFQDGQFKSIPLQDPVSARVEQRLRRLATLSAQERLYQEPFLNENNYNEIYEREYEAQRRAYANVEQRIKAGDYNLATPERYLEHYLDLTERQLTRARGFERNPTPAVTNADPITKLYSPLSNQVSQVHTGVNSSHFEKFGRLISSGATSSDRLLSGAQTLIALPVAIAESSSDRESLQLITASYYGRANLRQVKTGLQNRAKEKVRYQTSNVTGWVLGVTAKSAVTKLGITLYSSLGAFGGSVPFTELPLMPTFLGDTISNFYTDYQVQRLRNGNAALDIGTLPSGSLSMLRQHYIDTALAVKSGEKIRAGLSAAKSWLSHSKFTKWGVSGSAGLATKGIKAVSWALSKLAKPLIGLLTTPRISGVVNRLATETISRVSQYSKWQRLYAAWNKAGFKGIDAVTGLTSKYASATIARRLKLDRTTVLGLKIASLPQRGFNLAHNLIRRLDMVRTSFVASIEDYGLNKLANYRPATSKPWLTAAISKAGNFVRWFDRYQLPANQITTATAATSIASQSTTVVASKSSWLINSGKALMPVFKTVFGLAAIAAIYQTQGPQTAAVTAFVGGIIYGAAKLSKGTIVGKAIGAQVLKEGAFGSLLKGVSVGIDTSEIVKASLTLAISPSRKLSRPLLQIAYNQGSSGTAGLMTTFTYIPRFGIVGGLTAGFTSSVVMGAVSERQADYRYEQLRQGEITSLLPYASRDILRPAIEQTLLINSLGTLYEAAWKTKRGQKLSAAINKIKPIGAWQRLVDRFHFSFVKTIAQRAQRAFGDGWRKTTDALFKAAEKVGPWLSKVAGKILTVLRVGEIAYGTHQIFSARNSKERKEGYKLLGGALGSLALGAVVGVLTAPAEGAPGVGTAFHIGATIAASMLGNTIGEATGGWIADSHETLSKAGGWATKGITEFLFGAPAQAADLYATKPDRSNSRAWYETAIDITGSTIERANLGIKAKVDNLGSHLRRFWRSSKLAWGRFNREVKDRFITGYKKAKALATTTVDNLQNTFLGSGGSVTEVTASTYTPGGGGMEGKEIDARGRKLTRHDYAVAIPAQNLVKDQIPYGSIVEIIYKGKTVKATVTDGGPYVPGRQLDITQAAARAIGFNGVDKVGVRLVSIPKGADPNKTYYFGEATYRPKFGPNNGISISEANKAVASVVQGSKTLRLNSSGNQGFASIRNGSTLLNSTRAIYISAGHLADASTGEGGAVNGISSTVTYTDRTGRSRKVNGVTAEGVANLAVAERLIEVGRSRGFNLVSGLPSESGLGTHLRTLGSIRSQGNEVLEIHFDDRDNGRPGLIASPSNTQLERDLAKVYGYYANSSKFGAPKSQGGMSRFAGGLGSYKANVPLLEIGRLNYKDKFGSLVMKYQQALATGDSAKISAAKQAMNAEIDARILPGLLKGLGSNESRSVNTSVPSELVKPVAKLPVGAGSNIPSFMQPIISGKVVVSRTNQTDGNGLEKLQITTYDKSGRAVFTGFVNSGRSDRQVFKGSGQSQAGSQMPLEYGTYNIGKETAGLSKSVGKTFVPITPQFASQRTALGIHLDADRQLKPGTEGCLAFANQADLDAFRKSLASTGVRQLIFKDVLERSYERISQQQVNKAVANGNGKLREPFKPVRNRSKASSKSKATVVVSVGKKRSAVPLPADKPRQASATQIKASVSIDNGELLATAKLDIHPDAALINVNQPASYRTIGDYTVPLA
jgi:hypothetical protein